MLRDRKEAGQELAQALESFRTKRPVILGVANGGVEIACEIARHLDVESNLVMAAKLPYPDDPDTGFGALAEDGSVYIHAHAYRWFKDDEIEQIIDRQKKEIRKKIFLLRNGRDLPRLKNRCVILVDDGMIRGATMQSLISLCRNKQAGKIIVALPVSAREISDQIARKVDKLVVLEKPLTFMDISQVFREWQKVTDGDVLKLIRCYSNMDAPVEETREVA